MVSKCANPVCSATFRYMHEGRLFQVGVGSAAPEPEKVATLERFWLCGECSTKMTVVSSPDGVLVVPLQQLTESEDSGTRARVWDSTFVHNCVTINTRGRHSAFPKESGRDAD
jgi:hypothetical protein